MGLEESDLIIQMKTRRLHILSINESRKCGNGEILLPEEYRKAKSDGESINNEVGINSWSLKPPALRRDFRTAVDVWFIENQLKAGSEFFFPDRV